MERKVIRVFEFTEYPGPRYKEQGSSSGELFFEKVLKKAFDSCIHSDKKGKIILDLDGTAGYASSFIDECIGNCVYEFGKEKIINHLEIISKDEPDWIPVIFEEIIPEWEEKRLKGTPRKQK